MLGRTAMAVLTALSLHACTPVYAQQLQCGSRDMIAKGLAESFSEVLAARGVITDQSMMEMFLAPDGSWTVLATGADKRSCIVMSGDAFEFVKPESVKPGRGT